MVTFMVDEESIQAKRFIEYVRTLSFAKVIEEKKDFQKAITDCDAVPADVFFDELERRLDKHYME